MTNPKPVEEMTAEEIASERAAIAIERAALANGMAAKHAAVVEPDPAPVDPNDGEKEDEPVPAPWPHQHMVFGGLELDVRKPNESALIAISMTGVPALGSQGQMRIFTQFLVNHLSPESFAVVVESMTDPDSGVDIQGLITALTKLSI